MASILAVRGQQLQHPGDTDPEHELTTTNGLSSGRGQTSTNGVAASGSSVSPANGSEHFKRLNDSEIQRELTGTWVTTWGRGQTTTDVIAADGSFLSQTVGLPKGQKIQYHGTFLAKDGMVLGKAVFSNQTVIMHLHILQLNSHELVWSNDQGVTEPTFHKVGG